MKNQKRRDLAGYGSNSAAVEWDAGEARKMNFGAAAQQTSITSIFKSVMR